MGELQSFFSLSLVLVIRDITLFTTFPGCASCTRKDGTLLLKKRKEECMGTTSISRHQLHQSPTTSHVTSRIREVGLAYFNLLSVQS